jgi:hypothetical protein
MGLNPQGSTAEELDKWITNYNIKKEQKPTVGHSLTLPTSCFGSGRVLDSNSIFSVVSLSLVLLAMLLMSNTKCTNQQYWYKNVLSNNVTDTEYTL